MKPPGFLSRKPSQKLLRELLRAAREARSRVVAEDRVLKSRDVYAICYELARDLHGRYPDLRIVVGDLAGEQGLVQHHWIEIPLNESRVNESRVNESRGRSLYVDAACDSLDAFQPVRVGMTGDSDFVATHRNGVDANIDVNDPRNRPDVLYKAKSAWDPESL